MGVTRGIINAINGASISPSSISNLWDGTNVTADVDNSAVTTDALTLEPVWETTFTSGSGATNTFGAVGVDPTTGPFVATASPANDPGNDHGYSIDSVFWSDSVSRVRVQVTETESAGGGDVDVVLWRLNTP